MSTYIQGYWVHKHWFTAVFAAAITTACGGSGDPPATSTDLYGAYDVIGGGMSFTQVRVLVGMDPVNNTGDGPGTTLHTWETDRGTYKFTTLFVTFVDGVGVTRKVITGPGGNQSQSFQ